MTAVSDGGSLSSLPGVKDEGCASAWEAHGPTLRRWSGPAR